MVIPAKNEAGRIAATIRAAVALPAVDLILVVDDGSADQTQQIAREAGAVVVRHPHNRGKAEALETGAAVVAMRDTETGLPRILLFLDADLGDTAANAGPLIAPVVAGEVDFTIAVLPPQHGAGGHGLVVGLARRAIAKATGWTPQAPLSGIRCLTRPAFEAATPLAHGWGVETAMTIDLLRAGFTVREVPCDLRHRATGKDLSSQLHRAAQYRDVLLAVSARGVRIAASEVFGGQRRGAASGPWGAPRAGAPAAPEPPPPPQEPSPATGGEAIGRKAPGGEVSGGEATGGTAESAAE